MVKFSVYLNRHVFVMSSFGASGRLRSIIEAFPMYVDIEFYGVPSHDSS